MNTAILLSGGVDSIALAFWKQPQIAYTIDYGQLSAGGEIRAASRVCAELSIQHEVIVSSCVSIGSGDMAGCKPNYLAPVPEWWPFRNQLLITLAGMKAVNDKVDCLLVGTVSTDQGHADGTRAFYDAMNCLLSCQEGELRVDTPAIGMTSVELVRTARVGMPLLGWAHSCHVSEYACGTCRGCLKHRVVMSELGYGAY